MSSTSCFVWFLGMASLTSFFAWLALWAMKNVYHMDRPFVVSLCVTAGIISFIFAITALAGAVR